MRRREKITMKILPSSSEQQETRPADPSDGDAVDQACSCCRNIETSGGLLAACGKQESSEPLDPGLVAHAGWMIADAARKLRGLMKSLIGHGATQPAWDGHSNSSVFKGNDR
jgi:hypothetical protein